MSRTFWMMTGLIMLMVSVVELSAQTRRPRGETKRIVGETSTYWGATAAFNGISGLHYEWGLRNKTGSVSRSTVSITGGYASRWAGLESKTTFQKTKKWIHGVGLGFAFNNYISSPDEGLVWTLGLTGNVFFENTDEPKKFSNQLKNYVVYGQTGYRMSTGSDLFVTPVIGGGLMGSSFKSSTSSDVNGLYIMAGVSLSFKNK